MGIWLRRAAARLALKPHTRPAQLLSWRLENKEARTPIAARIFYVKSPLERKQRGESLQDGAPGKCAQHMPPLALLRYGTLPRLGFKV